jgi:hypothetical protein
VVGKTTGLVQVFGTVTGKVGVGGTVMDEINSVGIVIITTAGTLDGTFVELMMTILGEPVTGTIDETGNVDGK